MPPMLLIFSFIIYPKLVNYINIIFFVNNSVLMLMHWMMAPSLMSFSTSLLATMEVLVALLEVEFVPLGVQKVQHVWQSTPLLTWKLEM